MAIDLLWRSPTIRLHEMRNERSLRGCFSSPARRLTLLVGTDAVTAGWANVIATGVGTVPSFELNRRWVWGRSADCWTIRRTGATM